MLERPMTFTGESDMSKEDGPALLAVASFVVSAISLVSSWEANHIAKQSYERSTGRVLPYFHVNCKTNHVLIVDGAPSDPGTVPVLIHNDGSESIQGVRLEISMDIAWGGNGAYNQTIPPTQFTHEFSEILQPGSTASLDILPEVIKHAKGIKIPRGIDQSYWTACSVSCSAKLVGESHFASAVKDNGYRTNNCSFGLTWQPTAKSNPSPLNFGVNLGTPEKVRAAPNR
ncbi:hypothetical protein [Singulisphaera acidiphila]|nr:hypothetical protein [Singulisphaera acidiphila]